MALLTKQMLPTIISENGFDEHRKSIFLFDRESDNDPFDLADQAEMTGVCHAIGLCKSETEKSHSFESFSEFMCESQFGTKTTEYVYFLCCRKYVNDKLVELFDTLGFKYVLYWQPFKERKNFKCEELTIMLQKKISEYESRNKAQVDKERFHITDNKGNPTSPFDYAICEDIKKKNHIFIYGYQPYLYIGGSYKLDRDGTKIKAIIKKYLYERFIKSRIINQIYNLLLEDAEIQKSFEELNDFPSEYICFRDCMFDVKEMKTVPHNPKFYCINQIPWKYSDIQKATSKGYFDKYVSESIPDCGDLKMVLQYAGYCLTRATAQQKFLLITGEGGTGKSQLINLIQFAVGNENSSHVSLQSLAQRFQSSALIGKLLNCCSDLPLTAMEDISVLKMAVGEDDIQTERKGQDAFAFKNYAKLLFSANAVPPANGERTSAFYRRLLVLRMDIVPKQIDINLSDKLAADVLYFLKLAVNSIHEVYSDGLLFESENSKQAVKQARKDADVVQAWIDDECTIDINSKMSRADAFNSFSNYCDQEERQSLTKTNFYKALRQKKFTEAKIQGYTYFKGIRKSTPTDIGKTPPEFCTISSEELKNIPFD